MIGKHLVKLMTKFALRRNKAIRIADGYRNAKSIGVLHGILNDKQASLVNDFNDRIKGDGKKVKELTFVGKMKKEDSYDFNHFAQNDLSTNGKWKKQEVIDFQKEPFDYLISLDWETNKFTRSILASSKAKCRVGHFEENNSEYFELMINHSDDNFQDYLDQVYHYLTSMRNGQ